jgi:hypothetical protein
MRGKRQSGSKVLERGLLGMGDRRWKKIQCFHILGGSESKRLEVAALNLFPPAASSLFGKVAFLYCGTISARGGREGWQESKEKNKRGDKQ